VFDVNKKSEAFVFFDSQGSHDSEIVNRMNGFDNVREVVETEGAFDLVARISAETGEILNSIIDKLQHVANIKTILLLRNTSLSAEPLEIKYDESSGNQRFPESQYMECDQCGIPYRHCHCNCSFCGERDGCECALFEAATGG